MICSNNFLDGVWVLSKESINGRLESTASECDDAMVAEREAWTRFSLESLARAYDPGEPDYPLGTIEDLNPDYDWS